MPSVDMLYQVVRGTVILCWLGFAAAFVFRKRPPKTIEQKRDSMAMAGIALEAVGYFFVWTFRRTSATLLPEAGEIVNLILAAFAIAIAAASAWMTVSAVNTLGKQWAVAARIVEGHQLITSGPYARVRNPIYSGMFGMLIATGLAWSHWYTLLLGTVVFWIGTMIRVRIEEKLLQATFGIEFEKYKSSVPAIIPSFTTVNLNN
ncbi:MAG TPA: isoprenylcysteine carboxylmethyltransferase family protein [Bacteroidota bacterium]|jgi:protein-S-isoprenylcysteine O-methyltransferase Ste14|nr:isoprenylcysteine carboxylmethyltransferase family protein [Bacteroidota bacterium]